MKKLLFAVAVAIAAITAVWAPSLLARQQTATARFQYLVATPYRTVQQDVGGVRYRTAFRVCLAEAEWGCRNFEAPPNPLRTQRDEPEPALRAMLATLGSEGWELASVLDDSPTIDNELTYLFKRQQ